MTCPTGQVVIFFNGLQISVQATEVILAVFILWLHNSDISYLSIIKPIDIIVAESDWLVNCMEVTGQQVHIYLGRTLWVRNHTYCHVHVHKSLSFHTTSVRHDGFVS